MTTSSRLVVVAVVVSHHAEVVAVVVSHRAVVVVVASHRAAAVVVSHHAVAEEVSRHAAAVLTSRSAHPHRASSSSFANCRTISPKTKCVLCMMILSTCNADLTQSEESSFERPRSLDEISLAAWLHSSFVTRKPRRTRSICSSRRMSRARLSTCNMIGALAATQCRRRAERLVTMRSSRSVRGRRSRNVGCVCVYTDYT